MREAAWSLARSGRVGHDPKALEGERSTAEERLVALRTGTPAQKAVALVRTGGGASAGVAFVLDLDDLDRAVARGLLDVFGEFAEALAGVGEHDAVIAVLDQEHRRHQVLTDLAGDAAGFDPDLLDGGAQRGAIVRRRQWTCKATVGGGSEAPAKAACRELVSGGSRGG